MRVKDILTLFPDLRLRSGAEGLERTVRWVHVVDQPDMASWLRDGTFVLTTGIGWSQDASAHLAAVAQLADAGAAGLLIAVGRFLPSIPEEVVDEAERRGMPLVEAPFSLPFIDITDQVHRLLVGEQYKILEQADSIHRALTAAALEAGDLGQIAARLAVLLGCDLAIYGFDYRGGATLPIASIGDVPRGPAPSRAVRRALERREPLLNRVGDRQALYIPARSGENQDALLALFAREHEFGPLERTVAEHASSVIALHLAHQRELVEVERRVNASFVDALVSGAFRATDPAALERARLRGIDPDGKFRVVIARVGPSPALSTRREFELRHALLTAVETNLAAISLPAATTFSLNRVLVLWSSGVNDRENLVALRTGVVSQIGFPVDLVASSQVAGLQRVQQAAWEADRLMDAAHGTSEVLFYEDRVLLRLIGQTDPDTLRELRSAVIERLLRLRNGAELIATLETLIACGYSQREAAEKLHVHRNTMQKRCARIEEVLGRALGDPETQTLIYLSLAASRLP